MYFYMLYNVKAELGGALIAHPNLQKWNKLDDQFSVGDLSTRTWIFYSRVFHTSQNHKSEQPLTSNYFLSNGPRLWRAMYSQVYCQYLGSSKTW